MRLDIPYKEICGMDFSGVAPVSFRHCKTGVERWLERHELNPRQLRSFRVALSQAIATVSMIQTVKYASLSYSTDLPPPIQTFPSFTIYTLSAAMRRDRLCQSEGR